MPELDKKAVWPGWETVRLIGRGSFGAVYEIERELLGEKEKAALKVITIPQSSSDIDEMYGEGYDDESITTTFKTYLKNIIAEYSLMRKMNGSSNVVNCDDVQYVQHDDGMGWDIFIKMELLTPLTKALGKDASEEQVIRIGSDICKALVLCKKHNIIHRDIKPANIFVSENGDYKLGDFGIAKTVEKTSGGTKIGTYEYMAPEVYHDQPYGSTADIYSLGMVLYWLLNERRTPFLQMPPALPTSSEKDQARKRRFNGETIPEPAHGSEQLKRIVLKACAYDPKDRYQSAEEMLRDLERLSGNVHTSRQNTQNVFGDDVDQAVAEEESSVSASYQNVDYNEGTTAGVFRKPAPAKEEPASKPAYAERKPAKESERESTVATERREGGEDGTVGVFSRPKPAAAPAKAPETPKKSKKGLVFIIAAVLAAVAIGVGFFLFRAPKDTAKDYVPISEKRTYSDGSNLQIYYCYDEHAGRTESYYFGDKESYIGTYICDENGNIILSYDHNGRVTSFEYDENNKCVKENNYYSEDELKEDSPFLVSEYGYDNAGRRTMWKQTHYNDDGFSSTTTIGEYKGYKRVGASVVYANGDIDHIRVDATYDKNGDETSAEFYRENEAEPYSTETYEYDENRNLIRKVLSGSYGETTYEYEYKLRSEIIADGGYTPPVSAPEWKLDTHEELKDGIREDLWDIKNMLFQGDVYRDLIFDDGSARAALTITEDIIELFVYDTNFRYLFHFDDLRRFILEILINGEAVASVTPNYADEAESSVNGTILWQDGTKSVFMDDQFETHRIKAGKQDSFIQFYNSGDSCEQVEFQIFDSYSQLMSVYFMNGKLVNICIFDEYGLYVSDMEFRDEYIGGKTDAYLYADVSGSDPKNVWRTFEVRRFGSDGSCTNRVALAYYGTFENLIEYISYYEDNGQIAYHAVHHFDSEGNYTGTTEYDADGNVIS